MDGVARTLRRETLAASQSLSASERILLALRLGDSDAALLAGARGIDVEAARRLLRAQRQAGRTRSRCAAGG